MLAYIYHRQGLLSNLSTDGVGAKALQWASEITAGHEVFNLQAPTLPAEGSDPAR